MANERTIVDVAAIKRAINERNRHLELAADHLQAVTLWMLDLPPHTPDRDRALGHMLRALRALQGQDDA